MFKDSTVVWFKMINLTCVKSIVTVNRMNNPDLRCSVSGTTPVEAEKLPNLQGNDNNVLRVKVPVPVLLHCSGD